ncbi:hypothetical protein DOJK_00120 [Patescibacteria group bacterium]|nr:hypothetical protein DOJK_00120 [Patescibacteria group bacterium]
MLILAKVFAILVLVWFYQTARDKGEPAINWAVTGFIGYAIVWAMLRFTLVSMLWKAVEKNVTMGFLLVQIPAVCGVIAAYFIRKILIAKAEAAKNS